MSICGSRNHEEEEPNPINKEPIKEIDVRAPSNQTINSNASHPSIIKRTKKNKTRIPKNVMFKDEEEIIYPNKGRGSSILRFEEMSDEKIEKNVLSDEDKSEEKDDNFHDCKKDIEKEEDKQNQEKVDKKVEIINTDIPQNIKEINLPENKSKVFELNKDELIDNKNNIIKEEKETNMKNDYNKINNKDNNETKKEKKVKSDELENNEINEKNKEKEDEKKEIKEEIKDKEEGIKEEHIEKEDEIIEKEEDKVKDKEKLINIDNQKEELNENKINIEQKDDLNNNNILRSKLNKKEEEKIENDKQQIVKEEKKEEKGGEEENEKKEEEDIIEEKIANSKKEEIVVNEEKLKEENENENKNIEIKKNDENTKVEGEAEEEEEEENNEGEDDDNQKLNFLEKYKSLTEIININLEVNGLGKLSVKNSIDDLYKSFTDSESSENLISKLSDLLIELMSISQDSDKTLIKDFCKDLIVLYNGDKNKIYKQLMEFIEKIDEQEKLTTRKSNRIIRTYIQDSKDKLKTRLREEDIPSDKIISYELFNKIVEECEIKLKEEHMDVLLYQMKKAVPKGRNLNTLNAIVILDFLK